MNRLGKFKLDRKLLQDYKRMNAVFDSWDLVVWDVESNWYEDTIIYTGESMDFDAVDFGSEIPWYEIIIENYKVYEVRRVE